MENSFNNKDFEQFVKQNADQYRMFPSEKVWKNIHNTLHTRRRWYGIGLASLLLTTAAVTWVMLSPSGKRQQGTVTLPATSAIAKNNSAEQKSPEIIIAATKPSNNKPAFIASPGNQEKNLFLADVNTTVAVVQESDNKNEPVAISQTTIDPINSTDQVVVVVPAKADQPSSASLKPVSSSNNKEIAALKPVSDNNTRVVNETKAGNVSASGNKNTESGVSENKPAEKAKDIYPLSIESVVNSYTHTRKAKRLSWQVYFTPTVSYRELSENKEFLNSVRAATTATTAAFSSTTYSDINSVVTHKPDIGFQFGFNAGYRIFKKIKITAGLQFNVSKYDIRAYSYHTEIATIALNTGDRFTNSVSTYSNYRNFGGYKPNWLHNLYISASAPVGAELQITGNKKKYLGIGSTVQPTYVIADKSYLISTDYQHYAEVPSLTRNWNVNTSFEVFAGYTTGKFSWRIGPQVRYQMLSSYKGKYPVREHLFDFGLKVGLMLTK